MGRILREIGRDPTRDRPEFEVECDDCAGLVMVKTLTMQDAILARDLGRIEHVYCEKCKTFSYA
jgi:hypothetical protein